MCRPPLPLFSLSPWERLGEGLRTTNTPNNEPQEFPMTIANSNEVTVSGDGSSEWLKIPTDGDRIYPTVSVGNANNTWGASTKAALEYCTDATKSAPISVPLREQDNATAIVFTENDQRTLENMRGYVRINVTGYSGSDPITLSIV